MALVIPPGFAQANVEFRNDGDPDAWYITWGIDLGEAGGDFTAAAKNVYGSVFNTLLPDMSTSTSLTSVRLVVGQDGGDNLVVSYNSVNAGSSSGEKLPQNCALLVDKSTALGGRKNRGRFFVPNILNEGVVSNVGVITSGTVGGFQNSVDALLGILTDGTEPPDGNFPPTPMVILHNESGSTPPPTPVENLTVQNVISTQRRRLR